MAANDNGELPKDTYEIDLDSYPIVIVNHWGTLTDAQYAAYLQEMSDIPQALRQKRGNNWIFGDRMVLVYDGTHAQPPSANQRKMQADWIAANMDMVRAGTVGLAFVAPSFMLRGVIQAVFWLQPPLYDYVICGSLLEAYNWAEDKLDQSGVRRPERAAV